MYANATDEPRAAGYKITCFDLIDGCWDLEYLTYDDREAVKDCFLETRKDDHNVDYQWPAWYRKKL